MEACNSREIKKNQTDLKAIQGEEKELHEAKNMRNGMAMCSVTLLPAHTHP